MWSKTALTKELSIQYPLIQAGMAGGHTTPELVSAVSESGGLGTIGGGYMKPADLREAIRAVKTRTNKPFAVNLFIPSQGDVSASQINDTAAVLKPIAKKLSVSLPEITEMASHFKAQFKVVIEEEVPVFSFTFGKPDQEIMNECKDRDVYVMGTATTVNEALSLEKIGVHAVVAQGYEAGGHTGSFKIEGANEGIGLHALVSQMADVLTVPIVAAGGIMNGKGILAALALGASAVQMGTAFLTSEESGTDALHKAAILQSEETDVKLTKVFSGKWARGIENDMMRALTSFSEKLAPYPITNQLTQPLRRKAKELRNKEYMSLWAGQGVRLSESKSVSDLISKWVGEADNQLRSLTGNDVIEKRQR